MADVYHAHAYFEGRVQGVGFRYAALEVAREFEVSGYVENLADGRVHIEAEGKHAELESFISAVEERMAHFIKKTNRDIVERLPQLSGLEVPLFTGFAIR
ncbi:MAG: acylphosphatase [Verrucomicrobiota bacterium]|jgi:acylphosphatase